MLPETGFLRIREILNLVPVSRSSWWAGVKTGRYPRPVKLGPRTTAWRVEDIRHFIENPSEFPREGSKSPYPDSLLSNQRKSRKKS